MPTWVPLRAGMQQYCEPYYAAIHAWRKYDHKIVLNRIQLLVAIAGILDDFSQARDHHEVKLSYEYQGSVLLPEKVPTAGVEYLNGGDLIAFEVSKALVPAAIFKKCGAIFQGLLLFPIAGHSEALLATANRSTRASALRALATLLRLPEEAGLGKLTVHKHGLDDEGMDYVCPTGLLDRAAAFAAFLRDSADAGYLQHQQMTNKRPRPSRAVGQEEKAKDAIIPWTKMHKSVGTKVAAYFTVGPAVVSSSSTSSSTSTSEGLQRKLFHGTIVSYAPPSSSKVRDQLYHIVWDEDDDEEDYDELQMLKAVELFASTSGWTEEHSMVGRKVAAYFSMPDRRLFQGTVAKYSPPSAEEEGDQLYHIIWEDGDEEDYDETQLQGGLALYHDLFETVWLKDHASVGTKVAAYFPLPSMRKKRRVFTGRVTKFSPPSNAEEGDQLYHVVWEDGDEEDYDEQQLVEGKRLYQEAVVGGGEEGKTRRSSGRTQESAL